jgi:hypothetical protein
MQKLNTSAPKRATVFLYGWFDGGPGRGDDALHGRPWLGGQHPLPHEAAGELPVCRRRDRVVSYEMRVDIEDHLVFERLGALGGELGSGPLSASATENSGP